MGGGDDHKLSMGAQATQYQCPICGKLGEHFHKGATVVPAVEGSGKVQFIAASVVAAPRCQACHLPMEYLKRGTDWTCRSALCTEFNKPVVTGIGGMLDVQ